MNTRLRNSMVLALACSAAAQVSHAAPPRPTHVVIVIEENHAQSEVIGNAQAPYMNALATGGAMFTDCFAITHPSQPNYLQFYSGANQGVTGDTVPAAGAPFTSPNLGAAIIAAGASFVGYSEDLPTAGSAIGVSGSYYRKHNPWVNWQNDPPGQNQLPSTANQPFTSFPSSFDDLPDVSIVVPNQLHDMHDGTIAMADQWLQTNLGSYADWALTHNSLLIIAWDEDSSGAGNRNRIPMIFHGPMVRPGLIDAPWTLHNLQRTIAEMFTAVPSGAAIECRAIIGPFINDPQLVTRRFQNGAGLPANGHDTMIELANPSAAHGSDAVLVVDGSPLSHALVRFDSIFGNDPGRVPSGAAIVSSKLFVLTGLVSGDTSATSVAAHRMLVPWSESTTWTDLGGGVHTDGMQALASRDFSLIPNVGGVWAIFDVTESVHAWALDPASNFGWAIIPAGTDGWRWSSCESATVNDRPLLAITYDPSPCRPAITQQPVAVSQAASVSASFAVTANSLSAASYRWRRNGVELSDSGTVTGAITSMITIGAACLRDAGVYDCVVSNACGAVVSSTATLSICPADFNCSGTVSVQDLFDFLAAYFNSDPLADLNGMGLGVGDLFAFLAAFFGNC